MGAWITKAEKVENLLEVERTLRRELKEYVLDIPDNPAITRLSQSPSCYIINMGGLGENWSPEYHDTKMQAKIVAEIIESSDLANILINLNTIVETGKFNKGNRTIHFNPQMREYLKKLW